MKKIYIIGSKNAAGKNDAAVIARASKSAQVIYWEDLLFSITKNDIKVIDSASGADVKDAGLVLGFNWYKNGHQSIYRDAAYALGLYLAFHKVEFWNQEMAMQRSTTKLSATMQLALNGFDVPDTVFSLSNQNLPSQVKDFPMVIKDAAASRGRHNYLINNQTELRGYLDDQDGPNRYLLQEFIPNDGDLRIICFGSKPRLAIHRRRIDEETHLNNTSKGGAAKLIDMNSLSQALKQDCEKICGIMGRDMAGIDLMQSNDGLSRQVFLEVNAIPQLTSGSYVDQKLQVLADSLKDYLERK